MTTFQTLKDLCLKSSTAKIREIDDNSSVWAEINDLFEFPDCEEFKYDCTTKRTLLAVVSFVSSYEVFSILLDHGARPDVRSCRGDLAIHYACASAVDPEPKVRALVNLDKDCVQVENTYGQTPICKAFRYGFFSIAKLLIESGARIDVTRSGGRSLLHHACASNVDVAEKVGYILDALPDCVNERDLGGKTAFSYACISQDIPIINLLLDNGANTSISDKNGCLPIHHAAQMHFKGEETKVIDRLLCVDSSYVNATDNDGLTPLCYAVKRFKTEPVELLLARGADIKVKAYSQPMHLAFRDGHPDIVQLLVNNGFDVNVKDVCRKSPLHCYTDETDPWKREKVPKKVRVLLEAGADVNALDDAGNTPLHGAVRHQHYTSALLLLDHGAAVGVRNDKGDTALDYLTPVRSQNDPDYDPEHQKLYCKLSNPFHVEDAQDTTTTDSEEVNAQTLFVAAESADPEELCDVLLHGIDVRQTDSQGETALHKAAARVHQAVECVKLCLFWNINVNSQDNRGDTALHRAVRQGDAGTVQVLTSHADIDTSIQNENHETAFTAAPTQQIKFIIDQVRSDSEKHTQALVDRLKEEQEYLKDELRTTKEQAMTPDTDTTLLNHELKQMQKREQNQAAEISKLKKTEAKVADLESQLIDLRYQVQNMNRGYKHKSVVIQELKAEIKKLHGKNQKLINQVHKVQVKMTREGRFKATAKTSKLPFDENVIHEAFSKFENEIWQKTECEHHVTALRDKHLLTDEEVVQITAENAEHRTRMMMQILLKKTDKSWTPVLLKSMRQTPDWRDVTNNVMLCCKRLKKIKVKNSKQQTLNRAKTAPPRRVPPRPLVSASTERMRRGGPRPLASASTERVRQGKSRKFVNASTQSMRTRSPHFPVRTSAQSKRAAPAIYGTMKPKGSLRSTSARRRPGKVLEQA